MRPYRFPLLVRELGIVRRTLSATVALLTFALLALYTTFDPANRYRILADPPMLRSLLLPGALLVGAVVAWQAFVGEMRSGTWDGWLLLPRSRSALVLSKVGVGLAGITLALLAPVAVLWAVMRLAGGLGGPLVGASELLFQSSLSQALVVAWSTYLAAANAALLAREGQVGFLAPLLLPLVATARFFVGQEGFHRLSPGVVSLGWLVASGIMLALLVVSLLRAGRASSGLESGLRAALLTPAAGLAVLVVGLIGYESKARVFPMEQGAPQATSAPRPPRPYLREDGVLRTDADDGDAASMYSLRGEDSDGFRLHTPVFAGLALQLFHHESRPLLRAYDSRTGESKGCVGASGLAPCSEAQSFDSPPRVRMLGFEEGGALLTKEAVYLLRPDGQVELLLQAVAVADSVSMSEGIAIVAGGDLYLLGGEDDAHSPAPDEGAEAEEGAAPVPPSVPSLTLRCRGLAPAGTRVERLIVVDHPPVFSPDGDAPPPRPFSGAEVVSATDGSHGELVVCHDGEVSGRVPLAEEEGQPPYAARFGRGDAQALFVGPLVDAGVHALARGGSDEGPRWPSRRTATWMVALVVTALGAALVAARRKAFPWWVLPGLLLGPGYVLACVVLLVRRPRWAGLVGGLG